MKPYSLEVKAFYREGKNMVSIYQDAGGKITLYPTTTGGQKAGDYILHPEDIEKSQTFIQEALKSFEELVKIHASAFVRQLTEEEQKKA
jgi:hypothetical protein